MSELESITITAHGEDEVIEQLHDLAMSENKTIALHARLAKSMFVTANTWINQEKKRGTTPTELVGASAAASAVLLVEILSKCIPHEKDAVAGAFDVVSRVMVQHLEKHKMDIMRQADERDAVRAQG